MSGMALIERQTNVGYEYVKFVPRTNEATYLQILSGDGCQSFVRKQTFLIVIYWKKNFYDFNFKVGKLETAGPQALSLRRGSGTSLGCMFVGTVAHELIHALGFFHTQSRPDRNQFIRVLFQNIIPGRETEFEILTGKNTLGLPYDINSIMHYGRLAFSKDQISPTIEPLQPNVELKDSYEKTALTDIDVQGIRKLYDPNGLNNNNNNNNNNDNSNIFSSSFLFKSNLILLIILLFTYLFHFYI